MYEFMKVHVGLCALGFGPVDNWICRSYNSEIWVTWGMAHSYTDWALPHWGDSYPTGLVQIKTRRDKDFII